MNYKEQLLTIEWKKRRLQIIKRDNEQCTKCKSKNDLQVHHKIYINGFMAWEYPHQYLITLCKNCHKNLHKKVDAKELILDENKARKIKKHIPSTTGVIYLECKEKPQHNHYFYTEEQQKAKSGKRFRKYNKKGAKRKPKKKKQYRPQK
jgi:ribosomal protein L31